MLKKGMKIIVKKPFETLGGEKFETGLEGRIEKVSSSFVEFEIGERGMFIETERFKEYFSYSKLERRVIEFAEKGR